MIFRSDDELPIIQLPAHGPPGSTATNSRHPARHEARHIHALPLLFRLVSFSRLSYGLVPHPHDTF